MNVDQLARYELKYAIHPDQLDTIRGIVRRHCVDDGFSLPEKNGWYSVDTLYFDSPDWRIYQAAEDEAPVRTKLRVRLYPDSSQSVAKIEVKRRIRELVTKTSAIVPGDGWWQWLDGSRQTEGVEQDLRESLDTYLTLQRACHAQPKILIRYQRQAFRSECEDYVRVTFDRAMSFQPMARYSFAAEERCWQLVDDAGSLGHARHLLMELKFKNRPPVWMADMVRGLGLVRQGYSKYRCAVRRLQAGWDEYRDLSPVLRWRNA